MNFFPDIFNEFLSFPCHTSPPNLGFNSSVKINFFPDIFMNSYLFPVTPPHLISVAYLSLKTAGNSAIFPTNRSTSVTEKPFHTTYIL